MSGALTWGVWLGWDRSSSYDVVTGTVQTPYVTLQVLGCALTVGVVTAVLAARWHPVDAAVGVSAGFWLVWTVRAAFQDESGLFVVGAMMLGSGCRRAPPWPPPSAWVCDQPSTPGAPSVSLEGISAPAGPHLHDPPADIVAFVSYWTGVTQRIGPALAVSVVGGVVAWFFGDGWTVVVLVAGGTFLAAMLLPTRPVRREPPPRRAGSGLRSGPGDGAGA